MEQTTVSSRIPKSLAESLKEASESNGVFQSEIVRRALRYYVNQNPDNLDVFGQRDEEFATQESLGLPNQVTSSNNSSEDTR